MLFSALILLAGHVVAGDSRQPKAYASTADGRYQISPYAAPIQGQGKPGNSQTWSLSLDDTQSGHKQSVTGFGAAVTETTVDVFNQLPENQLAQLLRELMTSEGNNFGIMRHTIGSSDLSPEPALSYDDNGGNAGKVDLSLSHFNIGSRGLAMANMLKSMRDLNQDMTILGSCWGVPGWMKIDGMLVGAGDNVLNHNYSVQYGEYFVKYLQAYEAAGAHIDAITIQNEPLNNNSGMPSMIIEPVESGELILNHVAPALREAGLETEIWAYDHNTGMPVLR
jgi:O-glycosyl hydrolase